MLFLFLICPFPKPGNHSQPLPTWEQTAFLYGVGTRRTLNHESPLWRAQSCCPWRLLSILCVETEDSHLPGMQLCSEPLCSDWKNQPCRLSSGVSVSIIAIVYGDKCYGYCYCQKESKEATGHWDHEESLSFLHARSTNIRRGLLVMRISSWRML